MVKWTSFSYNIFIRLLTFGRFEFICFVIIHHCKMYSLWNDVRMIKINRNRNGNEKKETSGQQQNKTEKIWNDCDSAAQNTKTKIEIFVKMKNKNLHWGASKLMQNEYMMLWKFAHSHIITITITITALQLDRFYFIRFLSDTLCFWLVFIVPFPCNLRYLLCVHCIHLLGSG